MFLLFLATVRLKGCSDYQSFWFFSLFYIVRSLTDSIFQKIDSRPIPFREADAYLEVWNFFKFRLLLCKRFQDKFHI